MTHFAPIQQVYSQQQSTRREVAAKYGIDREPSFGSINGYRSPFASSPKKTFPTPSPQKSFTTPSPTKTFEEPKEAEISHKVEETLTPQATVNDNETAPEADSCDPFEQLMAQYPCYKHMFENQGLLNANGVSFPHEVRMISNKTQEEIAKEKAVQQLQVQCVMAGADAILGLRCEYIHQPEIGVCICTAYGTAVKYKLTM